MCYPSNPPPVKAHKGLQRVQLAGEGAEMQFSVTDLGRLGGASQAWGINDRAQVVGAASLANGGSHAFLWEKSEMRDLGGLPGFQTSTAEGINASGHVVGYAWKSCG